MISISTAQVKNTTVHFRTEINALKNELKTALNLLLKEQKDADKISYVEELIKVHHNLICAHPRTLKTYARKFAQIIPADDISTTEFKPFRDSVIKALGYSVNRSNFYPQYFQKLGLKSCVYCNSQLTISAQRTISVIDENPLRGKFQVDHFLPKNEFPGLSISLYNLYPICSNCNVIKGTKRISFDLYKDGDLHVSDYFFKLDANSKLKYLLDRNPDDLRVSFTEPITKKGFIGHNDLFDINGIYQTQYDIVEELILKAEVYTSQYRKSLQILFPTIFSNPAITKRLLIGNYTSDEDIHKRPLVKFNIDICKQLGLLDEKP